MAEVMTLSTEQELMLEIARLTDIRDTIYRLGMLTEESNTAFFDMLREEYETAKHRVIELGNRLSEETKDRPVLAEDAGCSCC